MPTITLNLSDGLWEFVESRAAMTGAAGYVRGLLREAQTKEYAARLETLVGAGLETPGTPVDDACRRRLRARVETMLAGNHWAASDRPGNDPAGNKAAGQP